MSLWGRSGGVAPQVATCTRVPGTGTLTTMITPEDALPEAVPIVLDADGLPAELELDVANGKVEAIPLRDYLGPVMIRDEEEDGLIGAGEVPYAVVPGLGTVYLDLGEHRLLIQRRA